jgi:ATP-binding cassette subfamily F protein uup
VFLVSHDRAFMDNVVTSIIACEATEDKPGFWREYEGSVQDWLTQSQRSQAIQLAQNKLATNSPQKTALVDSTSAQNTAKTTTKTTASTSTSTVGSATSSPSANSPSQSSAQSAKSKPSVKLSYKEQRELEGLPGLIESLEKEQQGIREALADSSLFAKDPAKATAMFARDAQIDEALLAALERWEMLSAA